jgi:stalled ribosome alternative rescue factor ArfA
MNKKIYKQAMKKTGDELQEWLQFKRRGSSVQAKKGKGSYSRKQKYKDKEC